MFCAILLGKIIGPYIFRTKSDSWQNWTRMRHFHMFLRIEKIKWSNNSQSYLSSSICSCCKSVHGPKASKSLTWKGESNFLLATFAKFDSLRLLFVQILERLFNLWVSYGHKTVEMHSQAGYTNLLRCYKEQRLQKLQMLFFRCNFRKKQYFLKRIELYQICF